jgi:arginine exporter protein ArgO
MNRNQIKLWNKPNELLRFSKLTAILAAVLLRFVSPVFAAIENPTIGSLGTGDAGNAAATVFANIWRAIVVMAGIAFIIYFAWGALSWLTSGGDKARVEEAREKISNATIGLILVAASVAITTTIGLLFNIDFLTNLTFEFPEAP